MPSILRDLPAVGWIAGKNFTFNGQQYKVGDEVPDINEFPRLEVFVRTRTVIPIVEETQELPFQFRHMVMTKERAAAKLGITFDSAPATAEPTQPDLEFNPADHDINGVLEYVEENPDEALSVYALEEEGKNRTTLLKKLDEVLNRQAEQENEENPNV